MATLKTKLQPDRRTLDERMLSEKLRKNRFPNCYGHCPDVGRSCPTKEEFEKFISENKKITFSMLPKEWECRTCMYTDNV